MSERILVACDGSACADRAVDVVADAAWPTGSLVRIVTALPSHDAAAARAMGLNAGMIGAVERDAVAAASEMLGVRADRLAASGCTVSRAVLRGRASTAITGEARRWDATLVVAGSRGLGAIATAVLGSTSAELVDRVRCPVLVVRDRVAGPVVLATDGSPSARAAEVALARLPWAAEGEVRVVSVAELGAAWAASMTLGFRAWGEAPYAALDDQDRAYHEAAAGAAVGRLRRLGVAATRDVRAGDAAEQILDAARGASAGLIVVGSRGRTGLTRLVLGSVSRKVVTHAPVSVLVVRAAPDATDPATDEADGPATGEADDRSG